MSHPERISRRRMLGTLGALGIGGATGALTLAVPRRAAAQTLGVHESVEAGLKRLFGGRPLKDGAGVVKLEVPLIAENGAVVQATVEVQSPMTPADHVKAIYIISDKNRRPMNAKFTLTPLTGAAVIGTNLRLGETTDVRAIAELGNGSLLQAKREVKVTVGGCGG
jgi:sulfur-oxidizing protein SoxY